jgi:hypothetical protein
MLGREPDEHPWKVIQEISRVRRKTKWFKKGSVNKKYGSILDQLNTYCEQSITRHRRQSFYKYQSVGAEHELSGTKIARPRSGGPVAFVEIAYGQRIAVTEGQVKLGERGARGIPLAELQVEGATGGAAEHTGEHGMIEVVTGPLSFSFADYDRSVDFVKTLIQCIDKVTAGNTKAKGKQLQPRGMQVGARFYPFSAVADLFNREMRRKGKDYEDFKLLVNDEPNSEWKVAKTKNITSHVQINFDVPLRNICTQDFKNIFSPKLQPTINACQQKARELFPSPGHIHIASILALYYFNACMKVYTWATNTWKKAGRQKPMSDSDAKNIHEMLLKTPVNDLIRLGLTEELKNKLLERTADPIEWIQTRTQMTAHLYQIIEVMENQMRTLKVAKKVIGEERLEKYLKRMHRQVFEPGMGERYTNETDKKYGDDLRSKGYCGAEYSLPDEKRSRICLRIKGHTGAHGYVEAELAFSSTGKPLPVVSHWFEEQGTFTMEPVVVFEDRKQAMKRGEDYGVDGLADLQKPERRKAAEKRLQRLFLGEEKKQAGRKA